MGRRHNRERMEKCKYGNQRCLCQDCTSNAAYEGCKSGYCILCYECEDKGEAVHDVWLCTAHEQIEIAEEDGT